MDKINRIFIGIAVILLLFSCENKETQEMMEKTDKIEKGMTKAEVEKILGTKPKLLFKNSTNARGNFIVCDYSLGHAFGYYFVVNYTDDQDSLVISSYWP